MSPQAHFSNEPKLDLWDTHSYIDSGVHAERRLFGREGLAGTQDVILVASAGFLMADIA